MFPTVSRAGATPGDRNGLAAFVPPGDAGMGSPGYARHGGIERCGSTESVGGSSLVDGVEFGRMGRALLVAPTIGGHAGAVGLLEGTQGPCRLAAGCAIDAGRGDCIHAAFGRDCTLDADEQLGLADVSHGA